MDPFFRPHPSLNHRRVNVQVFDELDQVVEERRIRWEDLTSEERLQLERLLAKACQP